MNTEPKSPTLRTGLLFLAVLLLAFSPLACSNTQEQEKAGAGVEQAAENQISSFPEYTLADRQKKWCFVWKEVHPDAQRIPREVLMDKLTQDDLVFRYITDDDTVMINTSRVVDAETVTYTGFTDMGSAKLVEALKEQMEIELTMIDKHSFTGTTTWINEDRKAELELYATDSSCW